MFIVTANHLDREASVEWCEWKFEASVEVGPHVARKAHYSKRLPTVTCKHWNDRLPTKIQITLLLHDAINTVQKCSTHQTQTDKLVNH